MNKVRLTDDFQCARIVHGQMRMRDWKISHQELLSLFKDVIEMGVTTFDPEEAARAFSVLRREGKVLHFGVSNIRPAQTAYSARFSNKQKARSHNSRAS